MDITRIAVIGSGTMGSQIAMACALAGYRTTLQDIDAGKLHAAERTLKSLMDRQIAKGRRSAADIAAAAERLDLTTELAQAVATADLAIEAATEKLELKQQIFRDLHRLSPPHAILATNSSTLGSSAVASVTGRPGQVCNMHFFNPALVMKCVEVVRHEATTDRTIEAVVAVARTLGKEPVVLNREIPGFIANRLMAAIRDEALRLHGEGIADFRDIDTAARTALGHPMGPFELMDLVGLDVSYLIRQAAFERSGDPADLPHPELERRYAQGHFGRKTGRGWYSYEDAEHRG